MNLQQIDSAEVFERVPPDALDLVGVEKEELKRREAVEDLSGKAANTITVEDSIWRIEKSYENVKMTCARNMLATSSQVNIINDMIVFQSFKMQKLKFENLKKYFYNFEYRWRFVVTDNNH